MKNIDLSDYYEPQPRQAALHLARARQVLYGGAAGGGKSRALRWDAIIFCLQNPGLDAYLFRRTIGQLESNHIRKILKELPPGLATYHVTKKRLEFGNGSGINFCYCEHEMDVENYQGHEINWLGIDEAGQFTPYQVAYLKTRARLGDFKPKKDADFLPRVVMTANPGGPCHQYLKDTFMKTPAEEIFYDESMRDPNDPEDKGWPSIFIPAKMDDNAHLDSDYASSFGALPDWQQKMLRDGDWNVVAGAFFDCFSTRDHVIRPFKIPEHWTRFRAMDYGHATPFWVGWFAVSDGEFLPEGALVIYREWYGSSGGNNGLRLPAEEIAVKGKQMERGEHIQYGVADPSMWRVDSGPSAAEKMARMGWYWQRADNQRIQGWQEVYSRFRNNMLFIFDSCPSVAQNIPILQHNPRDPEDVLKQGEDHPGDGVRYGCMSRPYIKRPEKPKRPITSPLTFNDLIRSQPALKESRI